jgi:hypothetical protein
MIALICVNEGSNFQGHVLYDKFKSVLSSQYNLSVVFQEEVYYENTLIFLQTPGRISTAWNRPIQNVRDKRKLKLRICN